MYFIVHSLSKGENVLELRLFIKLRQSDGNVNDLT